MALTDQLIACWEFESGALTTDATGTITALTNTGVATSVAGKVNNALSLVNASSQYLSHANNSSLNMNGASAFSIAVWVKFTSILSGTNAICSQYDFGNNQRSWFLIYDQSSNLFNFRVSSDGTTSTLRTAATFGTASTGTWYYVVCVYTGAALKISVNAGTQDSTAYSSGAFNSSANFLVGGLLNNTVPESTSLWDGLLDQLLIYKRDISSDISTLYNSGNGFSYAAMQSGIKIPVAMHHRKLMAA